MVPAIATFVILQRFIVRALTSGAIKGQSGEHIRISRL
jgi:ABC-type maltose transport system permease subunit